MRFGTSPIGLHGEAPRWGFGGVRSVARVAAKLLGKGNEGVSSELGLTPVRQDRFGQGGGPTVVQVGRGVGDTPKPCRGELGVEDGRPLEGLREAGPRRSTISFPTPATPC